MSNLTESLGVALLGACFSTAALAQFAEIDVPTSPTTIHVIQAHAPAPAQAAVVANHLEAEAPAIHASASRR